MQQKTQKPDTADMRKFWKSVVIPILNKDKKTVMSKISSPVSGNWHDLMHINKKSSQTTYQDFEANYDKLFNDKFLSLLSKKSFMDIHVWISKDTTWFSFDLMRRVGNDPNVGESQVILLYYELNNDFYLKNFSVAGGNFYFNDNM